MEDIVLPHQIQRPIASVIVDRQIAVIVAVQVPEGAVDALLREFGLIVGRYVVTGGLSGDQFRGGRNFRHIFDGPFSCQIFQQFMDPALGNLGTGAIVRPGGQGATGILGRRVIHFGFLPVDPEQLLLLQDFECGLIHGPFQTVPDFIQHLVPQLIPPLGIDVHICLGHGGIGFQGFQQFVY